MPQTGPCAARVPPRSSEIAQRRAVEGITGSSPRLLQLLTGTQHLARAALRGSAMCCCGASLDAGFSQRGRLTCASVLHSPRAVASVCGRRRGVSWSARQQEQGLSLRLSAQICLCSHEPCTYLLQAYRTHSAACHSLPGTQGPRPTRRPDSAVGRRAAVHTALCTAQAALSSTSIPSGTKTVSAATTCQTPALGYTPARISHSGPAARS